MDTEVLDVEQVLRERFAKDGGGFVAAYLYGSVARGTEKQGSDVDVAVLTGRSRPRKLEELPLDLEGDLEILLGRSVQVTVLDGAPVDLVHRVLCEGRLVLDANPSARIAFEVRARNDYFDLMPVLARYRRHPLGA